MPILNLRYSRIEINVIFLKPWISSDNEKLDLSDNKLGNNKSVICE